MTPHGSASQHMTCDRDGDDRRHHEDDRGGDRARRQPPYSANAVTGGAAAAKPRAEADQQSRRHDDGPARRQFWRRHPVTDRSRDDGASISPAMKAMRQALSSLLRRSTGREDPLMPAIRPVEQHQNTEEQADQRAADRRRYRSEIGHDGIPFVKGRRQIIDAFSSNRNAQGVWTYLNAPSPRSAA